MRIALAIEVEVPDGTDLSTIVVAPYGLGLQVGCGSFSSTLLQSVRYEVHPDVDAVFTPEDER